MRIASWSWGGRHHVGIVSADGREATPLLVDYAGGAALRLVEALVQGESLPPANRPAGGGGCDHAARADPAPAPQPVVRRPQLPLARAGAVGQRVPRQPAQGTPVADGVHQVSGNRHRSARHRAPARPGGLRADRLRERTRGGHRPRRARHQPHARDGPRARLHDRQRRQRARRAGAPPAVAARQELRHLLPDGAVDRHRRRARRPRHAGARLGHAGGRRGRAAPGRDDPRHDFRHPDADRDHLARHHAAARRHHRHRHAGGRRHGLYRRRNGCARATLVRIEIDGIGVIENRFE